MHNWLVMGLVAPMTVAGSSMAPTLEGPRRMFRCNDCRYEFAVGLDHLIDPDRAVCPRCGRTSAHWGRQPDIRGDRLLVDRTAFALRSPKRWEVVVFRSPQDANQLVVKRIVGLPGEAIAIRDGEVLIDGTVITPPSGLNYSARPRDRVEGRLNPGEYFVVGDNGAVSEDSRNWLARPGLDEKLLIGKPICVR
jgi:signal peptidase I